MRKIVYEWEAECCEQYDTVGYVFFFLVRGGYFTHTQTQHGLFFYFSLFFSFLFFFLFGPQCVFIQGKMYRFFSRMVGVTRGCFTTKYILVLERSGVFFTALTFVEHRHPLELILHSVHIRTFGHFVAVKFASLEVVLASLVAVELAFA